MTRRGNIVGLVVLFATASVVGYTAWRLRAPAVAVCGVCTRPMHERSGAVGLVDGQKRTFCCPACALTANRQMKGRVKILQLNDYVTDEALAPEAALVVVGSDTNHCVRQRVILDRDRHPSSLDFDRCSPSMFAFARREDAEAFLRLHGGSLSRFSTLAAAPPR